MTANAATPTPERKNADRFRGHGEAGYRFPTARAVATYHQVAAPATRIKTGSNSQPVMSMEGEGSGGLIPCARATPGRSATSTAAASGHPVRKAEESALTAVSVARGLRGRETPMPRQN